MQKSIKKNYIYNLAYQLLNIIIPIIVTPYLARILGPSGNGIYSYTTSIAAYFVLFGSLGVALYGQREIAYVQEDDDRRSLVFTELVIMRVITMTTACIVFGLIFCRQGEFVLYYRLLLLELVANAIDITWMYQGMEVFKKIVLRNCAVRLVSLAATFLLVRTANDVWVYVLIYAAGNLGGNLLLWLRTGRYVKWAGLGKLKLARHIKPMFVLFIPQIAIQVYTVLDRTMLGIILDDMQEVGFYEQSQKLIKILLTVITSMGAVMLPRIASHYAKGEDGKIKEYMGKSFRFLFALAYPMVFGLIAIAGDFVPIFFGAGYDKVVVLMSLSTVLVLLIGMSNITGNQFLLPTKRQGQYTISVVVGAVVNFLLNMILIRSLKSMGATIATVIAEVCVTGVQLFFVRKDFNLRAIFRMSFTYLIAALVMFLACLGVGAVVSSPVACIVLQLLVGMAVYVTMLLILRDTFIIEVIATVKNKIIKRN